MRSQFPTYGRCEFGARTAAVVAANRELPLVADIERGLESQEFKAFIQPKIHLLDRQVVGGELLARWNHPTRGFLPAGEFIPVMVRHGLIDSLLWSLFEQALTLQENLKCTDVLVPISLNMHPEQLANNNLVARLVNEIEKNNVSHNSIIFEILESATLPVSSDACKNALHLRRAGCGLSLDDFGSGYSALERLIVLPFTEVKLDRTFVQRIQDDFQVEAVISCALTLTEKLGMSLVVEGVETALQYQRLTQLGVQYAQGYFFARPMPSEIFIEYCGKFGRATSRGGTRLLSECERSVSWSPTYKA
ncbi:EAL domain-containing protein [Pseudomonas protegens]|uniref:EAL domain-containing protein n=1 Tax=Pseudomonas protegens TaxID=380021 RepID=UPI003FD78BF6